MRSIAALAVLTALATSACDRNRATEAPAEVDAALEQKDLSGNDITAIDAAFASDAGMVEDLAPDAEVSNLEYQTEVVPPPQLEDDEDEPARQTRPAPATAPAETTETPAEPADDLAPRPESENSTN